MNTVVLTGGRGIFGKFLIADLLKNHSKIVLLVRAETQKEAEDRVKNLLKAYSDFTGRIKILKSDLVKDDLGLSQKDYLDLVKSTTHIIHAAASTRFTLPLIEARRNNVETTKKLLSFAENCKKLKRFGFISTAFVAGKRSGIILEEEFKHTAGFLNTYEESKYEAETFIRSKINSLPIVIFRPSLIITPLQKTNNSPISALTLGLFLARKGFLPVLPGNENNKLDIIEGAIASRAIIEVLLKKSVLYLTYHITSADNSPQIKDLISLIEGQSGKKLPIRFCGNIEEFTTQVKKITRFRPDLVAIYKKTQSFLPELAFPKVFDNSNLLEELKSKTFSTKPLEELKILLK